MGVMPPLVVAHRGASEDAPEHTLAAYEQALADGAAGLEADIRLTADGHLVCVHDRRLERTSNGTGALSTLTLAQLEEVDFGATHQLGALDEQPDRGVGPGAHGVLTLPGLLDLVLSHARPTRLLLETKHPTRYAGYVEQRLAEVLAEFGLDRATGPQGDRVQVTLMTFSEVALRRMRRLAPQLPLVYLMERVPLIYRSGQLPRGVAVAGPWVQVLREHPRYVQRVHDQGGRVFVWTVDDPDDVALATRLEVDAIITNRPRLVREQVHAG